MGSGAERNPNHVVAYRFGYLHIHEACHFARQSCEIGKTSGGHETVRGSYEKKKKKKKRIYIYKRKKRVNACGWGFWRAEAAAHERGDNTGWLDHAITGTVYGHQISNASLGRTLTDMAVYSFSSSFFSTDKRTGAFEVERVDAGRVRVVAQDLGHLATADNRQDPDLQRKPPSHRDCSSLCQSTRSTPRGVPVVGR